MKQVRSIAISKKSDQALQQGESSFKFILLGFLALCWLCKSGDGSTPLSSVQVTKYRVAAVGDRPYHRDSSAASLTLDRFGMDGSNE